MTDPAPKYSKVEVPAGEGQLIVLFTNADFGGMIDVDLLVNAVADDAKQRRGMGWRLMSVASIGMRQSGTAGDLLFHSGGQVASQAALMAVYSQS